MAFFKHSVVTMSWIDPKSGLQKVDKDPGLRITQTDVFSKNKCRFANFVEVEIAAAGGTDIGNGIFTHRSDQYAGPSFASFPPKLFLNQQQKFPGAGVWKFVQTVGPRTLSPEFFAMAIGSLAGPAGIFLGNKILDALSGHAGSTLAALPPIWTTIEFTIFADGTYQAKILAHSLFPSMTVYMPASGDEAVDGYVKSGPTYDGVPNLQSWITEGWGAQRPFLKAMKCLLARAGNPWGITMATK